MKSNINKLSRIVSAIAEKYVIQFNYKNEGLRVCNPHCVYVNKNNKHMIDAYQVSGKTNSNLPNWKQFSLDSITELEVLNKVNFEIESGFNPLSNRYIRKITMIDENLKPINHIG